MLTMYMHAGSDLTYTTVIYIVGSTSIVQDHGHGTSVMGVMKMGNRFPKTGIKFTSLVFWTSVLTLTPPRLSDVYQRVHVYVAH